ncbi:MAG: hypothetical protein K2L82_11025 [Lachnospiraceae bacterium]|nr:hypothetical protein [Lachnospiraceae bacterium]
MAVNFNVMDLGKAGLISPERIGYKDSLEIIQDESLKIQKSFVKIGWHLKHIRDNELYKEDGYTSINECAANQLGYSQSTTSRLIKICERFSKNGNSPELDEKYEGFDKSQMIEMLPMEPEEIERVTSDMTVTEIRAVKNERIVNKPDDGEIRLFCRYFLYDISEKDRAALKEYMVEQYGKSHASGSAGNMDSDKVIYQCSPRGISINSSDEITWAHFVKRVRELEQLMPESCFGAVKEETIEDELPGQTSIEKDFPEYLPEPETEIQCAPNLDLEAEKYATSHKNSEVSIQGAVREELNDDSREESVIDAAEPSQYLEWSKLDEKQRDQKEACDELAISESDREEDEGFEQPEFPILKNNEQRAEWLRNYKNWGMWYRDEHIDVNYYKFDFPDGSRLIVAEYPQRYSYINNQRQDQRFYHLVGKNESYRHTSDSSSYLIDFLKSDFLKSIHKTHK